MAKKFYVSLMLIMLLFPLSHVCVNATNPDDIDLEAGYVDPGNGDRDHRSPVLIPQIGIDDYTLTFYTPCDGCTLRLLDENNDVVFLSVISEGTTSLALPSYLSGTYRIEIIRGNFCFWGFIYL